MCQSRFCVRELDVLNTCGHNSFNIFVKTDELLFLEILWTNRSRSIKNNTTIYCFSWFIVTFVICHKILLVVTTVYTYACMSECAYVGLVIPSPNITGIIQNTEKEISCIRVNPYFDICLFGLHRPALIY